LSILYLDMRILKNTVMINFRILILILSAGLPFSCGPIPAIGAVEKIDINPPLFISIKTVSPNEIRISFDETVNINAGSVKIIPETEVVSVEDNRKEIKLITGRQIPGINYSIQVSAADTRGNSNSFIAGFYGFNPDIPEILINEFTTQGTGRHPDIIELKTLSGGNMGGVVLYEGMPSNFRSRFVFPAFTVKKGEFILVHFKPQGIPEETDETENKRASGGYDSSDNAYDFWIKGGKGLSGNNGVLSLFVSPGGSILDGILYSNRTSTSDEKYRGFGKRDTLIRAEELASSGGWQSEQKMIRPEDGINPDDSTGTRSICRKSSSGDTNSSNDWHIVPTKKATFGNENSDEIY